MIKESKNKIRLHRKKRARAKISGKEDCPRLSIFKSLKSVYVQAINDETGKTLVSAKLKEIKAKNDLDGAEKLGELLAKKCLEKKITKVVFDRSGYKYHGKVKALADGARKGGLVF